MLLSAYPRDKLADPEGFVAQLGVVLEGYHDSVIIAVTDPRTGLQRRATFMPSIAEIVQACDDETKAQETRAKYAALPKLRRSEFILNRSPGRRANVRVPVTAPQYSIMFERTQSPDADAAEWRIEDNGDLFVAFSWFDGMGIGKWTRPQKRKSTDEALRAREIIDDGKEITASPYLEKALRAQKDNEDEQCMGQ